LAEKKTPPTFKQLNYKLNIILFFVTGTLWEPFYNLLCFIGLNNLSYFPRPEGVPSTKTSAIGQFFLVLSIAGAPFAYFRRYQLLHYYIKAMEPHLDSLPKVKNEAGVEVPVERPNCIEPMKFVWFVIVTVLLIGISIASFVIAIYCLAINDPSIVYENIWFDGAYMILMPIGLATAFTGIAFGVRTYKEEKMWFNAYNAIAEEVMKK